MSTELGAKRSEYAWRKRLDPNGEMTRKLGRDLAVSAIRGRLAKLPEQDRRIVLRMLVGPKDRA